MGPLESDGKNLPVLNGSRAENLAVKRSPVMIELATEKEHLECYPYVVIINSRYQYGAASVDDVWRIIGEQPFGACHIVTSPRGLNTDEFIPF